MNAETRAENAAAERLHHEFLTGLILYVLRERGADGAAEFVFRVFRAQHEEKFTAGLRALALDALPHPVACAQYLYLGNLIGGVPVEYARESDHKAWIRYPHPRWVYEGASICAVPRDVPTAFMRAYHSHCGVTLQNPRLGFVCTSIAVEGGAGGTEGYWYEAENDLAPGERLRFSLGEVGPPHDSVSAPTLPYAGDRLAAARRNYAVQYIRIALPALRAAFGDAVGVTLARGAGRLIGLQLYRSLAESLGIAATGPEAFSDWLCALVRGAGDEVSVARTGAGLEVRASGWRMMRGARGVVPGDFDAWTSLFEGALAAHDRTAELSVVRRMDAGADAWVWAIC